MRTRKRDYELGFMACHAVLDTPELLESILLYLDMWTLLLIQRVSHRWLATITGSTSLQRALFLHPERQQGDSKERRRNPVLAQLLNDCVPKSGNDLSSFHYSDFSNLPIANDVRLQKAFMHPTATWRRMLVTQPPIYKLGDWGMFEDDRPLGVGHLIKGFRVSSLPLGLRLGLLYAWVQEWLFRTSVEQASQGIYPVIQLRWTPHDPATLKCKDLPHHPIVPEPESMTRAIKFCCADLDLLIITSHFESSSESKLTSIKMLSKDFILDLEGDDIVGTMKRGVLSIPGLKTQFAFDLISAGVAASENQ